MAGAHLDIPRKAARTIHMPFVSPFGGLQGRTVPIFAGNEHRLSAEILT